ncbi:MAG: SocA family protein [Akkermansiaceae bacterium]|nr:SocA family protein [Akkermansiaceae bacterium]MCP5547214.1 SocA family protein [Akkermansiaceae bacterium]
MNSHKLEELIAYLGRHPGVTNLGPTKLWKLIYFIDAKAMRETGDSVTGSEFIKYEHGPVPSRGEKHLRKMTKSGMVTTVPRQVGGMRLNEVKVNRDADLGAFSADELQLVESVCKDHGGKSAKELSDLSHREPAWHYAGMLEKLSADLMLYGGAEDPDGL